MQTCPKEVWALFIKCVPGTKATCLLTQLGWPESVSWLRLWGRIPISSVYHSLIKTSTTGKQIAESLFGLGSWDRGASTLRYIRPNDWTDGKTTWEAVCLTFLVQTVFYSVSSFFLRAQITSPHISLEQSTNRLNKQIWNALNIVYRGFHLLLLTTCSHAAD